ncbi:hypothetical protein HB774_02565 [Rhizobium leguminosarum bv. viciae]|nr:hypothetical protein HB774_02565 [Rhizobium leguminosarum bv. viciae]
MVESDDLRKIYTFSKGGEPGSNGARGDGGEGGIGGLPGNRCYESRPHGRPGREGYEPGGTTCYREEARQGGRGDPGPEGPLNPAIPIKGQSKSSQKMAASFSDIAPFVPITQLKMMLSACYVSFANLDASELAEKLNWIYQIASASQSGKMFYDERATRAGATEVGQPSSSEISTVANQALLLLQRLRTGLDAFGHAPNYVSNLSPKYLTNASDRLLDIAEKVESEHEKYLTALSNLQDASEPLKASLELAKESIQETGENIREYDATANQVQDEIADLSVTIEVVKQKLLSAEEAFQDAISSKAGNCSLGQMIQFVVGVVAICYGMYQGAIAVADSFKTANSTTSDGSIIKDMQFLVDTFDKNKVDEHFKKMQDGFAKVQDALKTNDTKLVVSLESFETQLKPYLDMPEAVEYRDLMRQLVDVARAKNDKQVLYTQLVLKSTKAKLDEEALRLETVRVGRLVAETNNPALTDCVTFLTALLVKVKLEVLELLDLRRRALVYETLVSMRPLYKWNRVIELRDAQTALDGALTRAMDTLGRERQNFDAEFVLSKSRFPWVFEKLSEGRMAAFAIPVDDPQFNRGGTSFVTLYQVSMRVPV